jgi:hypothetical protein
VVVKVTHRLFSTFRGAFLLAVGPRMSADVLHENDIGARPLSINRQHSSKKPPPAPGKRIPAEKAVQLPFWQECPRVRRRFLQLKNMETDLNRPTDRSQRTAIGCRRPHFDV